MGGTITMTPAHILISVIEMAVILIAYKIIRRGIEAAVQIMRETWHTA